MGVIWWLFPVGVAMVATMLVCAIRYRPVENPDACPECGHEQGLDATGRRCDGQDDNNGWSSDLCRCQNDWHWNYESVAG